MQCALINTAFSSSMQLWLPTMSQDFELTALVLSFPSFIFITWHHFSFSDLHIFVRWPVNNLQHIVSLMMMIRKVWDPACELSPLEWTIHLYMLSTGNTHLGVANYHACWPVNNLQHVSIKEQPVNWNLVHTGGKKSGTISSGFAQFWSVPDPLVINWSCICWKFFRWNWPDLPCFMCTSCGKSCDT